MAHLARCWQTRRIWPLFFSGTCLGLSWDSRQVMSSVRPDTCPSSFVAAVAPICRVLPLVLFPKRLSLVDGASNQTRCLLPVHLLKFQLNSLAGYAVCTARCKVWLLGLQVHQCIVIFSCCGRSCSGEYLPNGTGWTSQNCRRIPQQGVWLQQDRWRMFTLVSTSIQVSQLV